MGPDEILAAAEEVLLLASGGSDAEGALETRAALVAERHPALAEHYPKLVSLCVSATTAERADGVRRFLSMMVEQMRGIDGGAHTFEDASKNVGEALGRHFLPPDAGLKQTPTK